MSKNKRHTYAVSLWRFGVPNDNVQGVVKDENNALIRLADAVAGFICDVLEGGNEELEALYHQGQRKGTLVEV